MDTPFPPYGAIVIMAKNILVLTGSPRGDGNSNKIAQAFIHGAESRGHSVTRFDAAFKKFTPCIACDRCWSNDAPCVFSDAFTELYSLLAQTHVLVIVTPVQWYSMTVSIKLALDKLYAYTRYERRTLPISQAMLLACAADGPESLRGVLVTYRLMLDYMGWEDLGTLTVPHVWNKDDILKPKHRRYLKIAENMGASISSQ